MSEKIVECSVCGKIHKVCSDHILERTFIPHEVTCPICGKVFILKWQAAQARQKEVLSWISFPHLLQNIYMSPITS